MDKAMSRRADAFVRSVFVTKGGRAPMDSPAPMKKMDVDRLKKARQRVLERSRGM